WAYRIGAGKRWPPATIQKYNLHKYGRKVPRIRPLTWNVFWKKIKEIEKDIGVRVSWSMNEWGMKKTRRYPCPYRTGDRVIAEVLFPGVFRGEYIGIIKDKHSEWLVTIPARKIKLGAKYLVEIISDKDSLLIAKTIGKL
ncbi:MAG: radical SAM protein, partial [Staphylothermus sp.]|nr:radical SAM protein [Staphylothermus sp.]